ncbi:MAG: hypothetical protein MI892_21660 [Desulfobacterales bacterium]|nr:hypothetical protein [Desulfobacterales bacterium]
MEKKYYCNNPECPEGSKEGVVKVLKQESVMDEKNVAQMFCPKCKSRLISYEKEEPCTAC